MANWIGLMSRAALSLGALLFLTAPASTQGAGKPTAIGRLEPGLWQLRDLRNNNAPVRSICVADPAMLMQIQHGDAPCSRLVIADDRTGTTVHYTCPAKGFGRTSVRVETPRLAKIDTQGIYDNAPFAYRLEARRVGSCQDAKARVGR